MAPLTWCVLMFVVIACQLHHVESELTVTPTTSVVSVAKDIAVGTTVVTLSSTGTDITYSLESQDPDTDTKIFAIDKTSGVVTVADKTDLNFDTVKTYTLVIKATQTTENSPDSGTATVKITVNKAPTFAEDRYPACVNKSSPGGTVVIQVTATDEDAGDILAYSITESAVTFPTVPSTASDSEDAAVNAAVVTVTATDGGGKTLVYTLESQDPDTTPRVFSIDGGSGAIKVSDATTLDYETTKGYELLIKATQSDGEPLLSATTTVTVTVDDVNEAPTFAKDMYTACVNKSSPEETVVVQVTASDEDDGDTITYTITAGNTDSIFAVEDSDGTIKVATGKTIGETPTSYSLTITATANDQASDTTTVSLNIGDPCPVTTPAPATTPPTGDSTTLPGVTPAPNFATTITASFCLFLISVSVHLLRIW